MSDEPDTDSSWVDVPRGVPSDAARVPISDDGKVTKYVLAAGHGTEKPPVMARVYCHVQGKLADGTVFLDENKEEFDFQVGRGEVASGLQMALSTMVDGEHALVICGPGYGYSDLRRPANVSPDAELHFDVKLLWFEKEKSLTDMNLEDKIVFATAKREIGKRMFTAGLYVSAWKQYDRGLTVLSFGPGNEEASSDPRGKELSVTFHLNIAACKHKLGEFSAAITHCDKALGLEPSSAKALFRRGQAFHRNGNVEQAKQDLQTCARLCSDPQKNLAGLAREVKTSLSALASEEAAMARNQASAFAGAFERGSLYEDKVAPESTTEKPLSICSRITAAIVGWCTRGGAAKTKQQ